MPWLRQILLASALAALVVACKPKKPPVPKPATAEQALEDEVATFDRDEEALAGDDADDADDDEAFGEDEEALADEP